MTKGFKKIAMITGLAVLLLLNVGCEDTETTTVIHPDGSCKRSVTVKSDSRDIFNEAYPVPRDSSWNVKKSIREGEQKEYTYFAEKNFKSAADLSDDYEKMNRGKVGGSISFELEKRYAWFFVYYTYKETYRELFPFRKVPRENHFTKEELEIMLEAMRNEKEAEKKYPADVLTRVEKKLLSWMGRSIFEELYQVLLQSAKELNHAQLPQELFQSRKEELYAATFADYNIKEIELEELLNKVEALLQREAFGILRESYKKAFADFDAKHALLENCFDDEYTNRVVMPGIIVDTNAVSVTGSEATWKFGLEEFLFYDHGMWISSRKINWWAVVFGGFIVILALLLLILAPRRTKKVIG